MAGRRGSEGRLRIIGGQWRGRKLAVADSPGLRPTGDRIRETLFNWLTPHLPQSRCLDLFAGSGVLGLEALSRGAGYCDFVERDRGVANALEDALRALNCGDRARVHCSDARVYLEGRPAPYDLVFLDPPFGRDLLNPTLLQFEDLGLLGGDALIYLEHPVDEDPQLPPAWDCRRKKRAGSVSYGLYARSTA